CSASDYHRLFDSFCVESTRDEELANGQKIGLIYSFDRELAKELNVKITGVSDELTVSGLNSAIFLSSDDIFRDLSVTFEGVSPYITMQIKNNSANSYIRDMVFNPEEYREYYSEGDIVSIRAFYSEEDAAGRYYSIDTPSEECVREYVATGSGSYSFDAYSIPEEMLNEAISHGKLVFDHDTANEYGVRVFSEAGLTPVYDSQKEETFNWLSPTESTMYFKTLKPAHLNDNGENHNQLDIVYIVNLIQANGVSTKTFCAVRFSDIIRNTDGSFEYDFSSPKLVSVSHIASRVRTNIVDSLSDRYDTVKLK
ncbi:MAG: hypothetical protein K6G22_01660, partial [Lachnospiraceae bacterium]|nr:hypothetical protein [Lachnospiraceae bacterium]